MDDKEKHIRALILSLSHALDLNPDLEEIVEKSNDKIESDGHMQLESTIWKDENSSPWAENSKLKGDQKIQRIKELLEQLGEW